MAGKKSLPGFEDQAPPDRYCDLILTGGVTSAIAYPGVIAGLGQAYRFNSIGGSSSGAGSAALAAAAEYRRRHGSSDGFRVMIERTAAVAKDVNGKTGLAWLFQPDPGSLRLFKALEKGFAAPDRKVPLLIKGIVLGYAPCLVAGFAGGAGILMAVATCAHPTEWLGWKVAAVFFGLLCSLFIGALCLWRDVRRAADKDYGLCSGQLRLPGAPRAPLTEWLHGLIQEIAGRTLRDDPLTFADLEDAPGSPRETLGDMSPAGAKSIDLRMFTANVMYARPQLLPQAEDEATLYFRPAEMRRLFPDSVVDHMKRGPAFCGPVVVEEPQRMRRWRSWNWSMVKPRAPPTPTPRHADDDALWPLPRRGLPIIVATRMSVSFPLLFSAVPLWTLSQRGTHFQRCLFLDGSLCANFPIHLFDKLIPAWPTFGVALQEIDSANSTDADRCTPEASLPNDHREGAVDRVNGFDSRHAPRERASGFVGAMLSTTKDWNDAVLARLPGVRERVVNVPLERDIGGLNILMTTQQIKHLAEKGIDASRKLLERYSSANTSSGQSQGWREHRWIRFNVLMNCLRESLSGLSRSANTAHHAEPLLDQIRRAVHEPPLATDPSSQLLAGQAAALEGALDALMRIEELLQPPNVKQPYQASPTPVLRIRPPL